MTLTDRILAFLEKCPRPVTAHLITRELNSTDSTVGAILFKLFIRGRVQRSRAGNVYQYELVRL